jgi:hypothetical protein
MKLKWMVLSGSAAILAVLLLCLCSGYGGNADASTPFIALSSVSVPEIPAKAAELVHAAAAPDREQTAQAVLHAVSAMTKPGVLPYVVSAICHGNPEVAGTVVKTAIELQPDDVLIFSQAAVDAAPGQVEQIVYSASKAAPGSCANIALVVSGQSPSANNLILAGLVGAFPGLKPFLEKAQGQVGTNDFEAVIRQTEQLVAETYKTPAK